MIPHCGFDLNFSNNEFSNVEHCFHVLNDHCMSSLEKCLFSSLTHFLIGVFVFLLLSCMISLYILDINHFSDTLLYISYIGCIVFCCSFCCAEAF